MTSPNIRIFRPELDPEDEAHAQINVEAPDDPKFRRYMDRREAQRAKLRNSKRRDRADAQRANWQDDGPTIKQLALLSRLGFSGTVKTKGEASDEISKRLGGPWNNRA